ncbi:SDR family NAD(P)-dependent oxidoreductase [Paracoccus sp. (in: a-proteobacteria)]|uniref:SDR family NAD(P)-dependent oxidoreductase n=1 Tax=Paracoccus sp. TaxID=267 RepID=UPI003A87F230
MTSLPQIDLSEKRALVTGGSKGMGLGIARALLDCGARVAIVSNEPASLDAAQKELAAGGQLLPIVADVTQGDQMRRAVEDAVAAFGGLTTLVNSAGIQRYGTITDTPENVWDDVMNVNVKGIFWAAKYAIPEIAAQGGGAVINLASVQAFASQSNVAAYTASKGAILALTRAMALDHAGAGVRVNTICPASIDTPMLRWAADLWKGDNTAEATIEAWGKGHPVGRVGRVDEVAAVAAFLASDLCPFMTGADIKIDGGVLSKLGIILPE